ncbi:hypothetical protein J5N97_030075 [Dioscorea zingiberensis]|uniref:Uncharacterized protein n=1 Tax=Dioscorea zingiberensis TaxID=325984 RepID=A0A9D5BX10_9LILI|nr:hypothetical protein J5N97_030075 [Dioscorea zingiberensis]
MTSSTQEKCWILAEAEVAKKRASELDIEVVRLTEKTKKQDEEIQAGQRTAIEKQGMEMKRVLDAFAHLASNGLIPSFPSSTSTNGLATATSNDINESRFSHRRPPTLVHAVGSQRRRGRRGEDVERDVVHAVETAGNEEHEAGVKVAEPGERDGGEVLGGEWGYEVVAGDNGAEGGVGDGEPDVREEKWATSGWEMGDGRRAGVDFNDVSGPIRRQVEEDEGKLEDGQAYVVVRQDGIPADEAEDGGDGEGIEQRHFHYIEP